MWHSRNKNSEKRERKGYMKILAIAVAVLIIAAFAARGRQRTVGTDILLSDVTEFYYTTAASSNPASRQQYRFYMEGEQWWFYHESREGSHWPLNEKDITACGAKQLLQQEYEQFAESISGGSVTKRTENTDSGGRGPWIYLYWKGDNGKYQQFSFADYAAQTAFEQFCAELKAE